ncbi:phosphoenolpyruvate carboxykinase (ATP) [Natranaerobius trueperi]|uniref:Phosphoenolpyruvate carboxykinase (ATP) n=1 Tax=Natranaerobius trueperi TaxID=759412 RepID=A0A226BW84_9FIRM|nr:phosphoenolpyruvate carboxykinase (ATP) [Natranaerobius trueperi]OWZ83042.1 phosphoenolpyruvate carboxykinase (ATP) [Natranaerobius trueperi]
MKNALNYTNSYFKKTHYNLPIATLVETAVARGEGVLTSNGALRVKTGEYTGRSPKDKFIVDEELINSKINWGEINRSISEESFDQLYSKVMKHLSNREVFIFDGKAGADSDHSLSLRTINERAWHNLFVQQLFIKDNKKSSTPEWTLINAPTFKADPNEDGTNSEVFVIVSFKKKTVLIGGTEYAGEMKKSIFSVLNYLLPEKNVLPMHCSANIGSNGNVSLFFGLSGTGKTTLSADPNRLLVGDDEHGWTERGIFNFEGGCYAKCIGLKKEQEPQIFNAIKFGSILENVILDPKTATPDFEDNTLTENTRAAYPIEHIPGVLETGIAGHPNVIIFLTADAFGVLPPVSKLSKEQAMYHFLSGYTSKLAGTERGVTNPTATFSACFGAPFMPLKPEKYAEMLGEKIEKHNVKTYLVNTGWTGGPYGEGSRIKLSYTRAMISAIQDGNIENTSYSKDEIFNVQIPNEVTGVPTNVLRPRKTWDDPNEYDNKAQELAELFQENFKQFNVSKDIYEAGPKA